jgi:hypothetical protein
MIKLGIYSVLMADFPSDGASFRPTLKGYISMHGIESGDRVP